MPPTLRAVVDLPGLKLARLAGPDGRDRPVRWVAVSELEDPRPFLEGGELLLSTGMRLPADDPAALAAYVERLVEADVTAYGLGVGTSHAQAPPALVEAAEAQGLPLLEVPARTPFIAVSKAVSALLAAEEYDAMARGFEAQRDLTRAALAPDGPAAVVARLARHVGGWVLALDAEGSVVHATPPDAAGHAARLVPEAAALRARGLLASAALSDGGEVVTLQPLGARGRVRGFLAVGSSVPLDRTAQSVVGVAVSLLSLAVERDQPGDATRVVVRAAALRLLIAGAPPADLPLGSLGWEWLTSTPLRVVVVAPDVDADRRAQALEGLEAAPGATDRVVVGLDGDLVVVVRDDPGPLEALAHALGEVPAGGSAPVSVAHLAPALTQARQATSAARGGGIRWFGLLGAEGMLGALEPAAARGVADALLAPLENRKGDLVASTAAWLAHHGQWDTAAAELGVHRHTLRYRLRRVEELLDRSLDDPDLRAELWLALRVRGEARPG